MRSFTYPLPPSRRWPGRAVRESSWTGCGTSKARQIRTSAKQSKPNWRGQGNVVVLLDIPGRTWSSAFSLQARGGAVGWLIVSAEQIPTEHERSLLRTLAQQIGVSLVNARLYARERTRGEELAAAYRSLESTIDIRDRVTNAALRNPGREGIAQAVYELTGFDVVIEDAHGHLRAWAGRKPPDPYPMLSAVERERIFTSALEAGGPVRERDRLLVVARSGEDVLGVLALIDPDQTAGEVETLTLKFAGTVLGAELARLLSLDHAEGRHRRDLIEELLAGTDEEATMSHARALGVDLGRPHRVVVMRATSKLENYDVFLHAARRAARDLGAGSLLAVLSGEVILISGSDQAWEELRRGVVAGLGGSGCRVGVGTICTRFADFSRSFKEAHLALKMQEESKGAEGATRFEDLGVFQLLAEVPDAGAIDQYVNRWLGDLIEHDATKNTRLLETLIVYLECGGNYDATATRLFVHRSTLKGRLRRIRTVSGRDLGDPDTRFNLELATRAYKGRRVFGQTAPPS